MAIFTSNVFKGTVYDTGNTAPVWGGGGPYHAEKENVKREWEQYYESQRAVQELKEIKSDLALKQVEIEGIEEERKLDLSDFALQQALYDVLSEYHELQEREQFLQLQFEAFLRQDDEAIIALMYSSYM